MISVCFRTEVPSCEVKGTKKLRRKKEDLFVQSGKSRTFAAELCSTLHLSEVKNYEL